MKKKIKVNQVEQRYYLSRKWDDIDYNVLEKKIIDSDTYKTMLTDENVERITNNLIKLIQRFYDEQAPIIKVKIREKNNDVLTKATKIMIQKK